MQKYFLFHAREEQIHGKYSPSSLLHETYTKKVSKPLINVRIVLRRSL